MSFARPGPQRSSEIGWRTPNLKRCPTSYVGRRTS